MKKKKFWKLFIFGCITAICIYSYLHFFRKSLLEGHKVVVCIPVYGQSLALGEEAIRVTDFERLKNDYNGRILTENLDYEFGCFDNSKWKQSLKKLFHYHKRSFELSIYGMAEALAQQLGNDTVICIFPGGQGTTLIAQLSKPEAPYMRLISDIQTAYEKARDKNWEFYVPAICWMQGESDIAEYSNTDYKTLLKQFSKDINQDIKEITHQDVPVNFISYQTNAITRGKMFDANNFKCKEIAVPQALMELVRDDSLFWPSGPIYPYSFAREAVHLDGASQKLLGQLAAKSAIRIIRHQKPIAGLIPLNPVIDNNNIILPFAIPYPPLVFDTINVNKIDNYGFNVITPDGKDIISSVILEDSIVRISCLQSPIGCKIRYAINGEIMKSGNQHGPRGNLRDSYQYWCYQFESALKTKDPTGSTQ